uniref:Uncharacterized protein n=1 Tax=Nothoprocta perdicaria TaxID=30464 RepID=A0A8C7E9N3_NOTPE
MRGNVGSREEREEGEGLSMASWCRKCGQQVPRNPPFTGVRITEGEMKSYHDFIRGCIKLERMARKGTCSIFTRKMPNTRPCVMDSAGH